MKFDRLAGKYQERADFFYVYIAEAHPSDGWTMEKMPGGVAEMLGGKPVPKMPTTSEERCKTAKAWHDSVSTDVPLLVDPISNRVNDAFSARPERLYILLEDTVVYQGGPGPFEYNIDQMQKYLESFI